MMSKKINLIFLTVMIAALSGCNVLSTSNKEPSKSAVLRLNPGENNPRNSEGDFITLKDGRILFIYSHFSGKSGSDFGNGYLASRYSGDKGKTWSTEDQLVVEQEGTMNVMSVSLLRLNNGSIALFYARKNSEEDCMPMMRISTDEARTWSDPVSCITDKQGYFVLNNNRVVQLKSGRLLMPVAMHKTSQGKWQDKAIIYNYYSDNNGASWTCSKAVPNTTDIITQEPGVVELNNGTVMMFIRASGGVQQLSYSKDKGETWSHIEPSNINSPLSPASIARVPSTGDLVMVWNNNARDQKRTPFNIGISKDEGRTWGNIKTLEDDPDGWYCYTAIHFTKKDILLGHCAGNRPKGTGLAVTQITKLSLDFIYK
ncbi:sialidase family protein [Daejeonella sp. JGW-45]|uniref:sialidase family protein n=1 Tax=Daejeonella sp. JGW-45 TaxID=3034148 RepID=UPI0023EB3B14|nr:sialidase family protein [Daejeonella sp. JGW-45]